MAFAILRTEKLKSFGEIGGSLAHNYRTRLTPNADPSRTKYNEHQIKRSDQVMNAIKARLPEKVRSNAVLCIEYMITASPEWENWGTEKEKGVALARNPLYLVGPPRVEHGTNGL